MQFPYILVEYTDLPDKPRIVCPWAPIEISLNPQFSPSINALGLVDSGADYTMINRDLGEYIGISEIESGGEISLKGVGGGEIKGFLHEIYLRVHNPQKYKDYYSFKGLVAFTDEEGFTKTDPQSTAIWGRIPVFSNSCVSFFHPHSFELVTNKN